MSTPPDPRLPRTWQDQSPGARSQLTPVNSYRVRNGQPHQHNSTVAVSLSSETPMPDGTISSYINKWNLITDLLPEK